MARILVIEDENILREEVLEWLLLEGYEASGAANGIEGVKIATHLRPDLIVCDITMPLLDGYGVLLEIRANPATATIPFIFVTARAAVEDFRQGMQLGADDYLTKPFTRMELLNAITTRLEKQQASQSIYQQQIEEWKNAFEQERAQRQLKAKLVAMFSHDLRNPLTTILSSNSLLRDYKDRMDDARRLIHFNRIEASVKYLLQMLDDILMVSQMESDNVEFKPQEVDIKQFLQQIVEEAQAINGDTHTIIFESHFDRSLMADPRLLRQIASNLLSNAIKYSPQDSTIRVFLTEENDYCVLTVEDEGIGVSEADQAQLFTAFQRGRNVNNIPGTGLGLAIVKHAVELHGGSVHIQSQLDVGTMLQVALPMR